MNTQTRFDELFEGLNEAGVTAGMIAEALDVPFTAVLDWVKRDFSVFNPIPHSEQLRGLAQAAATLQSRCGRHAVPGKLTQVFQDKDGNDTSILTLVLYKNWVGLDEYLELSCKDRVKRAA